MVAQSGVAHIAMHYAILLTHRNLAAKRRKVKCIVSTLLLLLTFSTPLVAEGILIFVPGFSGSLLVKGDRPVWLTPTQAFGLAGSDVELPYHWDARGQERDTVQVKGVLGSIGSIPRSVDICQTWLSVLDEHPDPVYLFSYDWRREGFESLAALENFVENVRTEYPGRKITFIGHSFGGILSLAFTNRNPELVEELILIGTPLRGNVAGFRDLQEGAPVGWNRSLLSPVVLNSFACAYSSFPENGCGASDTSARSLVFDYYSVETWKEQELGLFARPDLLARVGESRYETHLRRALAKGKDFRRASSLQKGFPYPPVTFILGNKFETITAMTKQGPRSRFGWDFETPQKEWGDGRLTVRGGIPQEGEVTPKEVFMSSHSHAYLLTDPKVISTLRRILSR